MPMLRLQKATLAAVKAYAEAEHDREVCGLVWATGAGVQTVHPLPNVHSDPVHYYRTAPKDVRHAFDLMDREGAEPLAWYHSHPGGKADPSEEDSLGAFNIGMHYLIAYPEKARLLAGDGTFLNEHRMWEVSAWECLDAGVLVQADYIVTP